MTPRAAISSRTGSSPSAPRAQTDTEAPASAKASAIARPMPRLPPVTTARLPDRSIFIAAPFYPCDVAAPIMQRRSPAAASPSREKERDRLRLAWPAKLRAKLLTRTAVSASSGNERPGLAARPRRAAVAPQSAQLADRILDVADDAVPRHGFGATSIEAVAKRAGISKRTFYHRFRGKEELFEAVVRRLIERWMPPFDAALLEAPEPRRGLQPSAEHMLEVALTPEALALHRMIIHEAQRFPSLARIIHELGAASGIERIARHLQPRIDSGELRADRRALCRRAVHPVGGDRAAPARARPRPAAGWRRTACLDRQHGGVVSMTAAAAPSRRPAWTINPDVNARTIPRL